MKFDMKIFENLPRKFKFYQNLKRTADTLHDDLCTCMMVFRRIFLEGEMLQAKLV